MCVRLHMHQRTLLNTKYEQLWDNLQNSEEKENGARVSRPVPINLKMYSSQLSGTRVRYRLGLLGSLSWLSGEDKRMKSGSSQQPPSVYGVFCFQTIGLIFLAFNNLLNQAVVA